VEVSKSTALQNIYVMYYWVLCVHIKKDFKKTYLLFKHVQTYRNEYHIKQCVFIIFTLSLMWAIVSITQWSKIDPMNLVVTGNVNKLLAEHNVLTNINVLKILFYLFKSFLLKEICESLLSEICIYQCVMRLNAPKYVTADISKLWQSSTTSHCLTYQKTRIFIKQSLWRSVCKLLKITIMFGLWSLRNIKRSLSVWDCNGDGIQMY
jgi:hypothetical protein